MSDIDGMSYSELVHWQAYCNLEPFGQERENMHAGIIASTIANVNSKKTFKPADFMIRSAADKRRDNILKFKQKLRGLSAKSSSK